MPRNRMELWMDHAPGWLVNLMQSRMMWTNVNWEGGSERFDPNKPDTRTSVETLAEAQAISSESNLRGLRGTHMIMLDIDVPAALIPSSTAGHSHLYIARSVTWENYVKLLDAMLACGILEEGYVFASKHRKATFLRLPWVKKGREKDTTAKMTVDELQAFLESSSSAPLF